MRLFIAVVAIAAMLLPAAVNADNGNIEPVAMRAGQDVDEVGRRVFYLLDRDAGLSLSQVLEMSDAFVRNTSTLVNVGTSRAVVWAHLPLRNAGERGGTWILSLNKKLVDIAEVYLVAGGERRVLLANQQAARRQSFEDFGVLAARVDLPAGAAGDVYIRFRGSTWSGLQLTLQTEASFHYTRQYSNGFFLVLLGGMAMIILFGCMPFVFMGHGIFLLYALAQSALFILYAHFEGITTVHLWPNHPEYGRLLSPLAFGVFVVSMAQFARVFFETARRARFADIFLVACVLLGSLAILALPLVYVFPAFDRRLPALLLYAVAIAVWLFLPFLAAYATRFWHREAWPLVIAWGLMSLFIIWLQLIWLGVVAEMPLAAKSYGVIALLEAFFIYLALALRVRAVRNDALRAHEELSASLKAQLAESRRSARLAEERGTALHDLAEKGRLLLAAGHDTRTMLSALRSYAAGLRRAPTSADVVRAGQEIDQLADSLNEILTTVIEGAHSGGIGEDALALDTMHAGSIMNPLRLIHGSAALDKGLDLKQHGAGATITTDRVLVARILSNLVSNAIKYTDTGRVLIACRPFHGGHRFQVWDSGIGIAPDALKILLDPQTGAVRFDHRDGGLGAGLGIAQALAARLGGAIEGRSTPGKGSVFELRLPDLGAGLEQPGTAEGLPAVALYDGDAVEVEYLRRSADGLDCQLLAATTAAEAESLLDGAGEIWRTALIDQHFGGTDGGIALAGRLAENVPHCHTAILTYDRSIEARSRIGRACGLILYKPVSEAEFRAALSLLRRKNTDEI